MDYGFESSKPRLSSPLRNSCRTTGAADPDTRILGGNARRFSLQRVIDPCSEQVAAELGIMKRDVLRKANAGLTERSDSVTGIEGSTRGPESQKRVEVLFVTPCTLIVRSYFEKEVSRTNNHN